MMPQKTRCASTGMQWCGSVAVWRTLLSGAVAVCTSETAHGVMEVCVAMVTEVCVLNMQLVVKGAVPAPP